MFRFILILLTVPGFNWVAATPAHAQVPQPSGCKLWGQTGPSVNQVAKGHIRFAGSADRPITIDCDTTQIVADEIDYFPDENRMAARGHVVYVTGTNRIAADRMEFNLKTKTGVFYEASGTAHLGERADRSMFGTQEPYAHFYGAELHKLGPKKFKIVRGGFTTCVQPSPRWEITSGSVTIVLEDHALLKNSIFKVKGVPVMYLPAFYYPIQEDDRSTGFIMPIYGNSTHRGQTITNQFFWAINRSQDATLTHDWFTKTGHGYGGEYRYAASGSSSGSALVYFVNEKEAELTFNGVTTISPARRSYNVRSHVTQALPGRTRLTANIDYFSELVVQQLYQQDFYASTNPYRVWGAATTSSWSGFTLSSAFNRRETFLDEVNSYVDGARPRITLTRTSTKLGRSPIYVGGHVDFLNQQREYRRTLPTETRVVDQGLGRHDAVGIVRVPFPTFSFMTVTSSLSWNGTRYTKRFDDVTKEIVPESLFRKYFNMGTEVVGPSFVRIWARPTSEFAARIKHVIEPRVEFNKLTAIQSPDAIIKSESSDYLLGGSTQIRYGISSRILVKPAGENAASRNLLSVSVSQTYYTDPKSSQVDPAYTSFLIREPSAFSSISISGQYTPVVGSRVNARVEYDPIVSAVQSISLGGEVSSMHAFVSSHFSHRRLAKGSPPLTSNNTLYAGAELRSERNMIGGRYSLDYDFGARHLLQQRVQGYYNAQCCGLIIEYQKRNYLTTFASAIPEDNRFNISFSLGGIGTFSNFLGALSGQPTRR
jgi:LPS-assembly protein